MRVHPVAQVELDAQRDPPGDQPPRDAEEEPQHLRARDRDSQRQQVGLALADLVDRAADEVGDEHAGRHRDGGQREGHQDSLSVGPEEAEESPEGLQGV